jgi:hypothetical protein
MDYWNVSMTPLNFLLPIKDCFFKQACPTKKPDYTFIGRSFRVIKTIPKNLWCLHPKRKARDEAAGV